MYEIEEMSIFPHPKTDTEGETTVWITVAGFRRGFGTEPTLGGAILKAICDSASLKTNCPLKLFLSGTSRTGYKAVLKESSKKENPEFSGKSKDSAMAIARVYLSFFDTLVTT